MMAALLRINILLLSALLLVNLDVQTNGALAVSYGRYQNDVLHYGADFPGFYQPRVLPKYYYPEEDFNLYEVYHPSRRVNDGDYNPKDPVGEGGPEMFDKPNVRYLLPLRSRRVNDGDYNPKDPVGEGGPEMLDKPNVRYLLPLRRTVYAGLPPVIPKVPRQFLYSARSNDGDYNPRDPVGEGGPERYSRRLSPYYTLNLNQRIYDGDYNPKDPVGEGGPEQYSKP